MLRSNSGKHTAVTRTFMVVNIVRCKGEVQRIRCQRFGVTILLTHGRNRDSNSTDANGTCKNRVHVVLFKFDSSCYLCTANFVSLVSFSLYFGMQ